LAFFLLAEIITRIKLYGIEIVLKGRFYSMHNLGYFCTRLPYPDLIYGLRPNAEGFKKGVYYKINSKGLRDYEYPYQKPNNTFRIAVLGDSFTEGSGVNFQETYAKILERKLDQNSFSRKYEVINFGVGGYNIDLYVAMLKREVIKYSPDLIIIAYTLNDIETINESVILPSELENPKPPSPNIFERYVLLRCILCEFLMDFTENIFHNSRSELVKYAEGLNKRYGDNSADWKRVKDRFEEIAKITQSMNSKVLVLPFLVELNNYPFKTIHTKIVHLARDNGFFALDMLPFFEGKEESQFWVYYKNTHPNSKANVIISDAIYDFLIKNKVVS
jgi:lysophospholipase L1-like esterase